MHYLSPFIYIYLCVLGELCVYAYVSMYSIQRMCRSQRELAGVSCVFLPCGFPD